MLEKNTVLMFLATSVSILLVVVLITMEMTIQLSDRVFSRLGLEPLWSESLVHSELDYYSLNSDEISVHGIINYKKNSLSIDRFGYVGNQLRPVLRQLGQHAAGVRVRFKTNSRSLHVSMSKLRPLGFSYPHISDQGSSGVDIYVDQKYLKTINYRNHDEIVPVLGSDAESIMYTVDVYFPSFSPVQLNNIGLTKGSRIERALPYDKSLAFYGTSITQGASAPRPGLTYPALLARNLNMDFYNYGFSGNGRGDIELATILSMSDSDFYILEYSRQVSDKYMSVAENLIKFCTEIKKNNPDSKIIILTALFDIEEEIDNKVFEEKRMAFRQAYLGLNKKYSGISLVEGYDYIGPNDRRLLVDGTHPSSEGMSLIAKKLAAVIKSKSVK